MSPRHDEETTASWLLWATDRHVQAGDHQAYDRVVARHGHTDHPVVRYTRAYLYDDGEDGLTSGPAAATWLREQGEDHAASLVEVAGVAAYLMGLGRFAELDTLAVTMEDRYRRRGPPTLLYFALGLRGYSAQFQGRHEEAARFFAESSGIYIDVGRMVAMEFVYMMAALDRLPEAARVLTHLDTTGSFGELTRNWTRCSTTWQKTCPARHNHASPSRSPPMVGVACHPDGR